MDLLGGQISTKGLDLPLPIFAPTYEAPKETMKWNGVSAIIIRYRTDGEQVRHLLPENLSLEQSPIVTLMIIDYGPSPLGACYEVFQMVEVFYNGKKYNYSILLVLDNQDAVYIGREVFGFPKVLGEVDFQPLLADPTAAIRGHCLSPLDRTGPALEYSFKPTSRQPGDGVPPSSGDNTPVLNLRLIPSSVPGAEPSIRQFVEVDFHLQGGEIWDGECEFRFPSTAASDPFHKIPVIEQLSATLVRKCTSFATLGAKAWDF